MLYRLDSHAHTSLKRGRSLLGEHHGVGLLDRVPPAVDQSRRAWSSASPRAGWRAGLKVRTGNVRGAARRRHKGALIRKHIAGFGWFGVFSMKISGDIAALDDLVNAPPTPIAISDENSVVSTQEQHVP